MNVITVSLYCICYQQEITEFSAASAGDIAHSFESEVNLTFLYVLM